MTTAKSLFNYKVLWITYAHLHTSKWANTTRNLERNIHN